MTLPRVSRATIDALNSQANRPGFQEWSKQRLAQMSHANPELFLWVMAWCEEWFPAVDSREKAGTITLGLYFALENQAEIDELEAT